MAMHAEPLVTTLCAGSLRPTGRFDLLRLSGLCVECDQLVRAANNGTAEAHPKPSPDADVGTDSRGAAQPTVWVAIQYAPGADVTLWGAYSSEEEAAAALWADYIEHHPGGWERVPVETPDGRGFDFRCTTSRGFRVVSVERESKGFERFEVRPCKVDERL